MISDIERLKFAALERLAHSAAEGDVKRIQELADYLRLLERALEDARRLQSSISDLAKLLENAGDNSQAPMQVPKAITPAGFQYTEQSTRPVHSTGNRDQDLVARTFHSMSQVPNGRSKQLTGRNLAAEARSELEAACQQRGIVVRRLTKTGTLLELPGRGQVAVPFATENEKRNGTWFFGIPEGPQANLCPYFAVILICATDGAYKKFIIPFAVLAEHWRLFSKTNGDVKFNLSRQDKSFYLIVPPRIRVPLDPYEDDFNILK